MNLPGFLSRFLSRWQQAPKARKGGTAMSATFYTPNKGNLGYSASLSLPAEAADHLLSALAYEWDNPISPRELLPGDLLVRVTSLHRQFALGHGREFTSSQMNARQVLKELAKLERVGEQALVSGGTILLFRA